MTITISVLTLMLVSHGFPQKDIPMLTCIAIKESNLNPKAVNHKGNKNGTKDHGLFQINDVHINSTCSATAKQLLNPNINIRCAKKVYKLQNLKAWSTYNMCKAEVKRL